MHFRVGSHPCETFPVNQDEFPSWKSSLQDFSCESGSIHPTKIIPTRAFLQTRINFPAENHPSQIFLSNQDALLRRKSSLPDIFSKSGCIPPPKIIPARLFPRIRINSPAGNHLCKKKPANQDYFPTKMHPRPSANHLAAAFQQSTASHQSAVLLTPGFFLPRLDPEQCPEASRPSEQYPLCLHSLAFPRPWNLFSGLEIFSLDDKRYGHILQRVGAVRSVMAVVIRGKP